MGLSILNLPEDPEAIDISSAMVALDADEADMELAGSDTIKDSIDVLLDGALALEQIFSRITTSGVSREDARKISGLVAGMREPGVGVESMPLFTRMGGNAVFTAEPSLEGLFPACESIKEGIADAFKKLLERILNIARTVINWVKAQISDQNAADLMPTQKARDVVKRPSVESIAKLLDDLADDPAVAAGEIARMAGGNIDQFTNGLQQEFENLSERLKKFFDNLQENPSFARIAAGNVSVRELLKQEADATINGIVGEVSDAAQAILQARNATQLAAAMERGQDVLERSKELSASTFDTSGAQADGGENGVKIGTILENLKKAVADTEGTDIKNLLSDLEGKMSGVMRIAEQTTKSEVEELIPEDADEATRQKAVTMVMALYSNLASLSQVLGKLWATRVRSLKGINSVLNNVADIIVSLERGISRLAQPLEQEQKEALQKALQSKGINIEL